MPRTARPGRPPNNGRNLKLKTQQQVDSYEAGRARAASMNLDMTDYVVDLIDHDLGRDQFQDHVLAVDADSAFFGDDRGPQGGKRSVSVRARLLSSANSADEYQWQILLSEKGNVLVHEESPDREVTDLWVFSSFDEARDVMSREDGPVGPRDITSAERSVPAHERTDITRLDV